MPSSVDWRFATSVLACSASKSTAEITRITCQPQTVGSLKATNRAVMRVEDERGSSEVQLVNGLKQGLLIMINDE
jgi:hypothetical protein